MGDFCTIKYEEYCNGEEYDGFESYVMLDIGCEFFLFKCNDFKMMHCWDIDITLKSALSNQKPQISTFITIPKFFLNHTWNGIQLSGVNEKNTYCALLCKNSIIKQCLHGNIAKH